MIETIAVALFCLAGLGLGLVAAQVLALRRHLSAPGPDPVQPAGLSILKPLCGADDDLAANLECFANLDHPRYEVLLGVRDRFDAAWPVAQAAAAGWPDRFRVVVQAGEAGLNPKVNQLVGLARAARHDTLVVSDSNVRVPAGYLREIESLLASPSVGLVTHPVGGVGERTLGSLLDNLHMAGSISPALAAAQPLLRRDIVVGKSMALRRDDLKALGGFESVKDVLAEDYVLGCRVSAELGKRVAIGRMPVSNVSQRRRVKEFLARYARWCVMQRQIAGSATYVSLVLLNPVLLGLAAAALEPGLGSLAALLAVSGLKAALDGLAARELRPGGFGWHQLALIPVKDLLFALSWGTGLLTDRVSWRGTRLQVLPGSRLAAPQPSGPGELLTDP